ncbi:MAG: hypothetical protein ACRDK7_12765 [Solirubrobacteraceae bacterium]
MSRTKLILLGPLAVVVIAVVAAASASEPPAKCGGKVTTTPNYCVAGFQLENSKGEAVSEKFVGTNGESTLKGTVASVTAEVKCGKGKWTGTIEDGAGGTVGKSKATITFEECKLVKPANCKLTAAQERGIETTPLMGELELVSGRIEDKVESKAGAFAGISIEGKESTCGIAEVEKPKTYNITGSQLCELDSSNTEVETEAASHKLDCSPSGGSLKIGGNLAEVSDSATLELSGTKAHDAWSVKEHT